jgi:hypothetical protein
MKAFLVQKKIEMFGSSLKERVRAAGFEIVESVSQTKRLHIGEWGDPLPPEQESTRRVARTLFSSGIKSLVMNLEDEALLLGLFCKLMPTRWRWGSVFTRT